jgi:hypothetical protein
MQRQQKEWGYQQQQKQQGSHTMWSSSSKKKKRSHTCAAAAAGCGLGRQQAQRADGLWRHCFDDMKTCCF